MIGIYTEADDEGRLIDSPKKIAGAVFPHDDGVEGSQVDDWLNELAACWKLVRYAVRGSRYIQVVNWSLHQKVSHAYESPIPSPSDADIERFASHSGMAPVSFRPIRERELRIERERANALESEFDSVWPSYPRKLAKGPARDAYVARRRAGIEASELLAATLHYAQSVEDTEPRFILHGSTFYGPKERWKDYLTAPERGRGGTRETTPDVPKWS